MLLKHHITGPNKHLKLCTNSSQNVLLWGSPRSFQGVYIIKIVFILLNLYLPKLSYSHECVVEFSKATWHVMRSNLNGMRVCIFLCFLDLSKVASLRFTYVHFQRLSQFGLRISTVFLLAIFGYICLISVTSLSSNKLFIWNPEVLRLT